MVWGMLTGWARCGVCGSCACGGRLQWEKEDGEMPHREMRHELKGGGSGSELVPLPPLLNCQYLQNNEVAKAGMALQVQMQVNVGVRQ